MNDIPRQYALVKVIQEHKEWLLENGHNESPLLAEDIFVFLGEIPNMPEHCIVTGKETGLVFSGYHIDHFMELSDSEI